MAGLFTAFDVTTLQANVEAILGVGVLISLAMLGATMIARGRAKTEKM